MGLTRAIVGLLAIVVLVGGCQTPRETNNSASRTNADQEIRKGAIDEREYRYLELANGLRVLLISDPKTDKAAASLAVHSGFFDEPEAIPGLAHFLEHMLFLGTAKYPNPDDYGAFIASNGGSHNAYTAGDHTNYFFDIAPVAFEGAIDRFAQFFIAPSLDSKYVNREKNAVHSEYQLQSKEDAWRINAAEKLALNPAHPAARFNIGSLETLVDQPNQSLKDALQHFYDTHYVANDMTLALYGRESLDQLESWTRQYFAEIRSGAAPPEMADIPLLREADMPLWLETKPEAETRTLTFSFALPSERALYREKPLGYLANLIGHEGEGSLHAALKAKGWIESLGAGSDELDDHHSLLVITIALTESGAKNTDAIGEYLFAYLNLLRSEPAKKHYFDEQATMSRLAFEYREPGSPSRTVTELTASMKYFPPAMLLYAPFAMDRFDPKLIQEYLDQLTPENALVTFTSPEAKTDKSETWFKTPYALRQVPAPLLARWQAAQASPDLHLPAANPFIPNNLALLNTPESADRPTRLGANDMAVWHIQDPSFRVPRANVTTYLRYPNAMQSASDVAHAALFALLVQDSLTAFSYPAALAGLNYRVGNDGRGLLVQLGGYNDKQDELLTRVLDTMKNLQIAPERFATFKAQLIRELENSRKDRPYEQTLAELPRIILRPSHTPDEIIAALQPVDVASLEGWRTVSLSRAHIEMLAHGNLSAADAHAYAAQFRQQFAPCAECADAKLAVNTLTEATIKTLAVDHPDAAFLMYVQGASTDYLERARFGLLAQVLRSAYFDSLRTEQQLGYVVAAMPSVFERTPGIAFVVQSPVQGAGHLHNATLKFLKEFAARLKAMAPAAFEVERSGLLSRLLERDKNLDERSRRFLADLDADIETFDSRERIAETLKTITQSEFVSFYDAFLQRAEQQSLVIYSPGQFTQDLPGVSQRQ